MNEEENNEEETNQLREYTVCYFAVANAVTAKKIVKSWQGNNNQIFSPDGAHAHYVNLIEHEDKSGVPEVAVACLNKLRLRDLPKSGSLGNHQERELDLDDNEGLIEKCYLALNINSCKLAVQQNGMVCRMSSLPRIIAVLANVSTNDITPVTSKPILSAEDNLVSFECSVVPSPGEEILGDLETETLEKALSEIHNMVGADESQSISVSLTAGKNVKHRKKFLDHKIFDSISGVTNRFIKAKAKLLVSDEQSEKLKYEVVDLLLDHKKMKIEVELEGRYPIEQDIVGKIKSCALQD